MNPSAKSNSYYSLVALWALCEAMIGGIIHGFHIPVSGLIVGSCAVVCISLIGWHHPAKGAILKATLVVAIFKMILSPQAPVTAYVAVFFQGLMGELLFWKKRNYIISCFLLAILTLLESAFQRILILTIVYGSKIWSAVNDMLNKLTGQQGWTNYSRWFIGIYIALHFIVALMVGWLCSVLPSKIESWKKTRQLSWNVSSQLPTRPKGKKRKRMLFVIWIFLIGLYLQSYLGIGEPLLPQHIAVGILLRSFIIVLGWVFIIGPLLRQLLHSWLKKEQTGAQTEMAAVLNLLPSTEQLVIASWRKASGSSGLRKYSETFKNILANALMDERPLIYILTASIGSGKTTSILNWAKEREQVYGVLSPVLNGKRIFLDIENLQEYPMEAEEADTDVLKVGRFVFSKASFDKASEIILAAVSKEGWLVIDEVGPLELGGQGLAAAVRVIINNRKGNTLLVVREGLAEKVIDFCQAPAIIIKDISELPAV